MSSAAGTPHNARLARVPGAISEETVNTNRVVFAWNRPLPGREGASGQLFQSFLEYFGAQQRAGHIDSFEPIFLEPRVNTVNGFILISGEPQKLRVA